MTLKNVKDGQGTLSATLIFMWTYRELNPELSNANALLYRLTISPRLNLPGPSDDLQGGFVIILDQLSALLHDFLPAPFQLLLQPLRPLSSLITMDLIGQIEHIGQFGDVSHGVGGSQDLLLQASPFQFQAASMVKDGFLDRPCLLFGIIQPAQDLFRQPGAMSVVIFIEIDIQDAGIIMEQSRQFQDLRIGFQFPAQF